MRALRTLPSAASAILLLAVALAVVAPAFLATADPIRVVVDDALLAPSSTHLFGTDQSGRDVFSRVVYGARESVLIGLRATAIALVVGLIIGTLVALLPRLLGDFAARSLDILLAFPEFLIALVVVAMLGKGSGNIALAITIAACPVYIRMARVEALRALSAEHIEAARLLGIGRLRTLWRHVIPMVLSTLSVIATIGVGTAILAAAGLSFLGLGVGEPTPEWGLMLSGGRNVLAQAWWVAVFPGLAVTATVLSISILGRRLRARIEERTV